jgi:8-oxo-dGTP diphosphatase
MNEYNLDVIRKRYKLVPRTLVFIEWENRILTLSKTKTNSFGFGKINGVGGHIEKGEEPFEAALREIQEEAGIQVRNLELVSILFIDINDTPGIEVFVFKAKYESGDLKDSEEGHLEWMTREEIRNNEKKVKDMPMLIDMIDNHLANTPPSMVKYIYDKHGELRIE